MKILVLSDPNPDSTQPQFVKDAYKDLLLIALHYEPAGERDFHPEGFYMVAVDEFLTKMKSHNVWAYEWLKDQWGPIQEASKKLPEPIQLLFTAESCEEIGTIH